jgi:PTS system ascorbate-specific IIA component
LAACNNEQHLQNMSRLSEMLMNEELVEELADVETEEDLLKLQEKYLDA